MPHGAALDFSDMTPTAQSLISEMTSLHNDAQARHLMRFFKTGKGQYGEGDIFLGIKVPTTRAIVKKYRNSIKLNDIAPLLASPYHEIRLAGFLLLVELFQQAAKHHDSEVQNTIVEYYLSVIDRGNNWDLVDLVAYKILGSWLINKADERDILDRLAAMDGQLWHQRVSIVSTLALIRNGEFDDTFRIVTTLLTHRHDLIHKASGWMLREVGKHGGKTQLMAFLNRHASTMPRTMLRYAIEHFSPEERAHYMRNQLVMLTGSSV